MIHVVHNSGGAGSWYTGRVVAQQFLQPGDHLILLFADTKSEDPDLYRFLEETAADVLAQVPENCTGEVVDIADGRDIWQVFRDSRFLGNTRIDPCSRILKRDLIRAWLEQHLDPEETINYIGIDWTEAERFWKAQPRWLPWRLEAPLTEPPNNVDKDFMLAKLTELGIEHADLYKLGFAHNNCGGFCVKAGQGQFKLLLEKKPETYAYHEQQEQDLRVFLGKDIAVLRDRRGGTTKPMTMRTFRERIEAETIEVDETDIGGCACFTPEEF